MASTAPDFVKAAADSFSSSQVAAFRLHRHYLSPRQPCGLITICREICGVQAQVMRSARLAFCARTDRVLRQDIDSLLWKQRVLIKTSAMRQTLHLLPTKDYHIYLNALKPSRKAALAGILARIGIGLKEMDALNAAVMEVLGSEPVPQRTLLQAIKPRISRKLGPWMKLSWIPLRPAIIEGLVCYGPEQGRETTLVRVDHWLGKLRPIQEDEAKRILLRNYLGAYGPATLQDFSRWSGISMKESRPVWESLQQEMREVRVEESTALILREDLDHLQAGKLLELNVRLLSGFDPYMLAHVDKGHLLAPGHYKRVYGNQWWISPVILVNGRVAGIWSCRRQGSKAKITWELFEKVPKATLGAIGAEAERIVTFLEGVIHPGENGTDS